jgi:ribosomal protein S18 acetylase RimI-like enzyme
MKKEAIIKKATRKDLREIAEIYRVESAKPPYNKETTCKKALEGIKEDFKVNDIYVVIINKLIVGFIMVKIDPGIKNQLWINELWILKEYQGQGIGKKLMVEIEEIYKKKSIKIFELVAHTKNGGALDFYKKLGYHIDNSMIYMRKRLR